jgi:hypothetical protein
MDQCAPYPLRERAAREGVCVGLRSARRAAESGRCESQCSGYRSPKGNRPMRRILTEVASAAVKTKDSHFQEVFRRLVPRLALRRSSGRSPIACAASSGSCCTRALSHRTRSARPQSARHPQASPQTCRRSAPTRLQSADRRPTPNAS